MRSPKLQPSRVFTTEFLSILQEEWRRITGTADDLRPKLEAQLRATEASQEKLGMKYLEGDKAIASLFERMNQRFEQEIADLGARLTDLATEEATIDPLVEFCKSMLLTSPPRGRRRPA